MDRAPEPTPASSTRMAGADVRLDEDGTEVLRVDDLGAPRHLEHGVGQGGPHHHEPPARAAEDGGPLGGADQMVVVDDADMGVEGGPGLEGDQVAAVLGVQKEHPLARPEDARIPVGCHVAQPDTGGGGPEEAEITRRSPGLSRVR